MNLDFEQHNGEGKHAKQTGRKLAAAGDSFRVGTETFSCRRGSLFSRRGVGLSSASVRRGLALLSVSVQGRFCFRVAAVVGLKFKDYYVLNLGSAQSWASLLEAETRCGCFV